MKASLNRYLISIIANRDKIFTRKFYETLQDDQTDELIEIECKNKKNNNEALEECKCLLESSSKYLSVLKKARDKVYCHLDKKSLSIDDCNNEIFCHINDDIVDEIINNISRTVSSLKGSYKLCHTAPYSGDNIDICPKKSEFIGLFSYIKVNYTIKCNTNGIKKEVHINLWYNSFNHKTKTPRRNI